MRKTIRKIYNDFMKDSLYKNSLYLMASTFAMAGLGFFFWAISARLFTANDVGLGATLISVTDLIATLSLLGLNVGLIRYLPTSERKSDVINTAFTMSGLITIVVSTIFLLGLEVFSPKLLLVRENLYYSLFFVVSIVFMTLFILIESVLIAFRSAKYVLIKSSIFGVSKLVFPFLLVSFGAVGLFASWTISAMLGFSAVFVILVTKFRYEFKLACYGRIVKKMASFCFGNYIAELLGKLATLVLPLMITNIVNPETTAYYYVAMMIASLLFAIPHATCESLFAEASHSEKGMEEHTKKTVKITALILIPAIIFAILLGKYILLLFGKSYSIAGFRFLQLLALSGIFISVNKIFGTILRVKRKIKQLVFISFVGALSILGLSYLLLSEGLLGVGLAWTIGKGLVSLLYLGSSYGKRLKIS